MSKTNTYESAILNLLLCATAIANVAQNGTSPLTSLSVSLHTADPGEGGSQNTSEAAYSGYVRVVTTRSTAGWVVSSGSAAPVSALNFPTALTTSTSTLTHFGIGSSTSGAGVLYYKGTLSPNINVGLGVTPQITTASSVTED